MGTASVAHTSELILASYGSPLRRPVIRWIVAAVLLLVTGFALSQVFSLGRMDRPGSPMVMTQSLVVTALISLLPIIWLRWLDRREPEPWFMYGLAFVWGGVIATGLAIAANNEFMAVAGELLVAVVGAPFIEEGAKGLGLLILLLLLRSEFDGPRDGFIYGFLVGLGFNWLESSIYITRGFSESGAVPWAFQLSSRYVLAGFDGHALYTSITGTFLGFSLTQKGWFRRIRLPLAGYLLAALGHMTWNSLGSLLTALILGGVIITQSGVDPEAVRAQMANLPLWMTWPTAIFVTAIASGVGYLIVFIGLRRSGRWERSVMVQQLADEIDSGVVTPDEYANIQGRCEPPKPQPARAIFHAQCNLAKRKFYLDQHGRALTDDPLVAAWRAEILALR